MTSLFLIVQEYREAADKLANLDLPPEVIADTLDGMSGEIEAKAQSVAHVVRSLQAQAQACREWAADAKARADAMDKRAEYLTQSVADAMRACGISKISGPGVALSFRTSTAVDIFEPGMLPSQFLRYPEAPPPAPDKRAIGEALKSGHDVPGARLDVRQNLQIK